MNLTDFEMHGGVAVITMTNAAKHNVLSSDMIDCVLARLAQANTAKARCVILRAQPGVRVWSAGHDVAELPSAHRDPLGWSDPLRVVIRAIEECPAPVIAQIEGSVWGGACELAFSCDILVAAPEVTFAITPAKLGIPYNISGLLTFTNTMNLHVVKEMIFTAEPVSVSRAAQLGAVNHVVPAGEIADFCLSMGRRIETLAPLAITVMKEELRVLTAAHSVTPRAFERVQGLRRQVYDGHDYAEGIAAFRAKRAPKFIGS
ncbi:MAG TPA: methylmalonyl-CoA decarboxylase [Rhodocyclaceae bacterium]